MSISFFSYKNKINLAQIKNDLDFVQQSINQPNNEF